MQHCPLVDASCVRSRSRASRHKSREALRLLRRQADGMLPRTRAWLASTGTNHLDSSVFVGLRAAC